MAESGKTATATQSEMVRDYLGGIPSLMLGTKSAKHRLIVLVPWMGGAVGIVESGPSSAICNVQPRKPAEGLRRRSGTVEWMYSIAEFDSYCGSEEITESMTRERWRIYSGC